MDDGHTQAPQRRGVDLVPIAVTVEVDPLVELETRLIAAEADLETLRRRIRRLRTDLDALKGAT